MEGVFFIFNCNKFNLEKKSKQSMGKKQKNKWENTKMGKQTQNGTNSKHNANVILNTIS